MYLDKAHNAIRKAEGMLTEWPDEAGRIPFDAARPFISDKTGRSAKTHRGVHSELHRLTRGDADFDTDLRASLGSGYTLRAVADYAIGPEATVSHEHASEAIETAKPFVAYFADKID